MSARYWSLLAVLGAVVLGAVPALAQTGPVVVISGRPDVAVTINGMIVNGAVVYGDWGLARPGHGELLIDGPVALAPPRYPAWDARGYFPSTGRQPRVGRQEIEPQVRRPRASTNFSRDWFIESDPRKPVTEYPPFDPPPVVLAPRRRHR